MLGAKFINSAPKFCKTVQNVWIQNLWNRGFRMGSEFMDEGLGWMQNLWIRV